MLGTKVHRHPTTKLSCRRLTIHHPNDPPSHAMRMELTTAGAAREIPSKAWKALEAV
jgi:hypothetical protein